MRNSTEFAKVNFSVRRINFSNLQRVKFRARKKRARKKRRERKGRERKGRELQQLHHLEQITHLGNVVGTVVCSPSSVIVAGCTLFFGWTLSCHITPFGNKRNQFSLNDTLNIY